MMRPNQMAGLAKIGVGSVRIVGGVMAGLGKGPIADASKDYSLGELARRKYAKSSITGGWDMLREGLCQVFG